MFITWKKIKKWPNSRLIDFSCNVDFVWHANISNIHVPTYIANIGITNFFQYWTANALPMWSQNWPTGRISARQSTAIGLPMHRQRKTNNALLTLVEQWLPMHNQYFTRQRTLEIILSLISQRWEKQLFLKYATKFCGPVNRQC